MPETLPPPPGSMPGSSPENPVPGEPRFENKPEPNLVPTPDHENHLGEQSSQSCWEHVVELHNQGFHYLGNLILRLYGVKVEEPETTQITPEGEPPTTFQQGQEE